MEREIERLQWITLGSVVVLAVLCAGLLLIVWLALNLSQLLERVRATLGRFTTEARRHGDEEQHQDSETPGAVADGVLHHPERSGTEGYCQTRQLGWEHFTSLGQGAAPGCGDKSNTNHAGENLPSEAVSKTIVPSVPPCLRGEHIASPYHAGQLVQAAEELNWIGGSGIVVPAGALIRLIACHDTRSGRRWSANWKRCHLSSIPEDMLRPLPPDIEFVPMRAVDTDADPQCEREFLAQSHRRTHTQSPTASG